MLRRSKRHQNLAIFGDKQYILQQMELFILQKKNQHLRKVHLIKMPRQSNRHLNLAVVGDN
jgi:ribonuclease HI